jgi:hypothetical protein
MKTISRSAAAVALLLTGHALAQEAPPCPRVTTTEDMMLQRFARGPEGKVYALTVGTAEVTYDYIGKSVCTKLSRIDGTTITPALKCYDMLAKDAIDDTPVIATSPTGRAIDMSPPMSVVIGEYEHHRLICKGVRANAELVPS